MKLDSLLVTGDAFFLRRHAGLVQALRDEGLAIETLAVGEPSAAARLARATALARFGLDYVRTPKLPIRVKLDLRAMQRAFHKDPAAFAAKSRAVHGRIAARDARPDLVLHVFGLSSPGGDGANEIPYAHYLDYTRALARRNDATEVPDAFAGSAGRWVELERRAYEGAARLFTTSDLVRRSLIADYGIGPEKIGVVGAGANFESAPHTAYGTGRVLFNASDFARKGGELVLAAWPLIRRAYPRATLVTVGRRLPRTLEGLDDRGRVTHAELAQLLSETDLVLAPALSDPFPGFVIEAMAAGVPAVVADRDAMPEIVTDGIDGVVLNELTPAHLAAVTIDVLRNRDRIERLAAAAVDTVRERLNWQRVSGRMVKSLREL